MSAEVISLISLLLNGALTFFAAIVLFAAKRYLNKRDTFENESDGRVKTLEMETVRRSDCEKCNMSVAETLQDISQKIDAGFRRSAISDMVLARAMLQLCEQLGTNGDCKDIKRLYETLNENVIWEQID